uniref:Uncharacterized protein n=1 Tax=Clastoptera arizonana TaxID=38151 RepID=A0A1B6E0T3_9HEMI
MIQKIKILQGELHSGLYVQETVNKSPHIIRQEHNNGRIVMNDSPQAMNPLAHKQSTTVPTNNSLQSTPLHHLNVTSHQRHLSTVMSTDIDSDTNSHCALLIPEEALKQGHNNNYALQDFILKRHHNQM